MADLNDPINPDDDGLEELGQTPYGHEAEEGDDDQPRRAASARFVVDSEVGSEAAMRDAMDPANQSLADALRLSFRVLQAVILVLVVLFLVSGFQTVKDGQTGVRTVWGKIVSVDGAEAISKGLNFSIYPFPIGEFVLFRDDRTVDLGNSFAPMPRGTLTHEQALEKAEISDALMPGRDGSLLTRDGDLAHLELSARYQVEEAGSFVRQVNDSDKSRDADKLVRLALQRSAVEVVAEMSLQEMIDQPDDVRQKVQVKSQQALDQLHCGIHLVQVQVTRTYAPLAIEKSLGDLQAARVAAAEVVDQASQEANKTRNRVAGKDYAQLIEVIERYEDSLERGNEEESAALLAAVNAKLDENTDGEVAQVIQMARTFQSQIESTLGNEYLRFKSLLPAYRNNPQLLIRQQWMDTYSQVLRRPDAEVIYVPDPLLSMTLNITGSSAIQELRRKLQIARQERQSQMIGYDSRGYIMSAADMTQRKMLDVKDGKAVPIGGAAPR